MRASLSLTVILTSLLASGFASAQYVYYPPPPAPDMRGPGFYYTNPCGQTYGPNYTVRPCFPPYQGALLGPCTPGQSAPTGPCCREKGWPYAAPGSIGSDIPDAVMAMAAGNYPYGYGMGPSPYGNFAAAAARAGYSADAIAAAIRQQMMNDAMRLAMQAGNPAALGAMGWPGRGAGTGGRMPNPSNPQELAQWLAYQQMCAAMGMSPGQFNPGLARQQPGALPNQYAGLTGVPGRPIIPVPIYPVPVYPIFIPGLGMMNPNFMQQMRDQQAPDGKGDKDSPVTAFPAHLFARSPRDFFMIETDPRASPYNAGPFSFTGRTSSDYP